MKRETALEVKDLNKNFGEKKVLQNISLTVETGEILGLVGPNGAGKTTLLKSVMGLILPSQGQIRIFGQEIHTQKKQDRYHLGFIADEPNLYEFLKVEEMLALNRRFFPQWDEERCQKLLKAMQLPPQEKIKHLSRGMKTQLALILALVPRPRLLLMDEPLEGLDPVRRIQLLNLVLEEFMGSGEGAILISSHHLEELERMVGRVAFLHEGKLKKVAAMDDFKGEEKTIRVVFQKAPPADFFSMKGIKKVSKEGELAYLLAIEENFPAIYEACSQKPHFVLEIYHRDLEDLFHEYEGGKTHV